MDRMNREMAAAFGLGTMGVPPLEATVGDFASAAGKDGLATAEAVARYGQIIRALLLIDESHSELRIKSQLEEAHAEISRDGGDVSAALARIDALLETHKDMLPA